MESYTKSVVKGVSVVISISLVSAILGYLVRILLARGLSVEDFGLFYAVFGFLTLVGFLKSLGFDKSLAKFIPEFLHQKRPDLIKSSMIYLTLIQIATNSVMIFFVYLFSDFLAQNYFHAAHASPILKLMAIAFFLDSFVLTLKFSFQGFRKMGYFAAIDSVRMLLILGIVFIGFQKGYGIVSPAIAYIITPIILIIIFGAIMAKYVFRGFFSARLVFDVPVLKKISRYSFFIILGSVGTIIMGSIDIAMLTYFSGLAAVALFSVAYPTARLMVAFPEAVSKVLFPLTSELWVKKKKKLLEAGMKELYKYTFILIFPLGIMLFSFSDVIIRVFFGEDYIGADIALKILVAAMLFASINKICGNFFLGIGKPEITSRMVHTGAIFNFASNLITIPLFGIIGAAASTALAYFIIMCMGFYKVRRFIDAGIPYWVWAKTIIAGMIFLVMIALLKKAVVMNVFLEIGIIAAISGICYIGMLFLFRIVTVNEVRSILKRVFR